MNPLTVEGTGPRRRRITQRQAGTAEEDAVDRSVHLREG